MTKIVGHRGAKGLEHENTIKGFKVAKELKPDAIEFDVLVTSDNKFVVCHDDDLKKLIGKKLVISKMTYAEVAEIHLGNGETIPLLYDVLSLLSGMPVVLDIKTDQNIPGLFAIIDAFPETDITVTSWLTPWVATEFKKHRPHIPTFVERYYLPFGLMRSVRRHDADGINLRYIWLNPLTYWAIRRSGRHMQVYTVNKVWHAKLIQKFYPEVWICTNHPDALIKALHPDRIPKSAPTDALLSGILKK